MRDPEFVTDFQLFWDAFPRRQAKKDALKAWRQLKPTTETVQKILYALAWQAQTDQWRRGIIPLPATYLRGERWEDERPSGGNGVPAPTPAEIAHSQVVRARLAEQATLSAQDRADEYYRSHPMFRPGKPS